ncbi:MAG TPA: serine hydrolase [Gaiellaceae bacterium]|nr:serine hydrolase [Gaiellaceae bacterium]
MIASPPLPPPVVERPAPFEVSYGVVSGRAPAGTARLVVKAGGRAYRDVAVRQRAFTVRLDLPPGETTFRVEAVDRQGRRSHATVPNVFALPQRAAPRFRTGRLDPLLARDVRAAVRGFGPYAGVYVQNLATGAGAAWNAKAVFPAASTLKLAIAVVALSREEGVPRPGSGLDALLRKMIVVSDDGTANTVLTRIAGSTSSGGRQVTEMMHSIGLADSEMYGGYIVERTTSAVIPTRVDVQPSWGIGKRTTAYDLARLARSVWLASAGRGPLHRALPSFTPGDARYLLYLLAHVRDLPKLSTTVGKVPGVVVLHKAGWINRARHDHGLVVWRGGVFVAAVMTYRPAGAGRASDRLAGRVAAIALRRFRG